MDCRTLGTNADNDKVAVPPRELLELCEQLVAFGPSLGPLDPLLGLLLREVELRDPRLLDRSGMFCALLGAFEQHLGRRR